MGDWPWGVMAEDKAKPRYRWQAVITCCTKSGLAVASPPVLVGGWWGAQSDWHDLQVNSCSERPEVVLTSDMTKHALVRGQKQLIIN